MRVAAHRFDNGLRYGPAEHERNSHFTPRYIVDLVTVDLGGRIGLDPCTTADNPTGAFRFWTTEDDGLARPWVDALSIFVNPPYGKAREPWVGKCITAGRRGQPTILLMPAATDTRVFREAAVSSTAIVFITGRVKFGTLRPNRRQRAASHPSALLGWNTALDASAALGWRAKT